MPTTDRDPPVLSYVSPNKRPANTGGVSLLLGLLSVLFMIVPPIGVPLAVTAIGMGIAVRNKSTDGKAALGIWCGVMSLTALATLGLCALCVRR